MKMNSAQLRSMLAHIRRTWLRLNEEEVTAFATDYPRFISAMHRQYGLTRAEIEKQLNMWQRESQVAA